MAPGAISYRKFFLLKEEGFVFLLASCLAEKLFNENGFLLTKLSEYCGAVDVNVSTLLKHAESVIRFDGDSVCVLSKHCHEGLMIDHNLDDHEQAYEVAIWGKRWPLKALACV